KGTDLEKQQKLAMKLDMIEFDRLEIVERRITLEDRKMQLKQNEIDLKLKELQFKGIE
ncbi:12619_t:CDS:2, partial [Funneliformis geosporum]